MDLVNQRRRPAVPVIAQALPLALVPRLQSVLASGPLFDLVLSLGVRGLLLIIVVRRAPRLGEQVVLVRKVRVRQLLKRDGKTLLALCMLAPSLARPSFPSV